MRISGREPMIFTDIYTPLGVTPFTPVAEIFSTLDTYVDRLFFALTNSHSATTTKNLNDEIQELSQVRAFLSNTRHRSAYNKLWLARHPELATQQSSNQGISHRPYTADDALAALLNDVDQELVTEQGLHEALSTSNSLRLSDTPTSTAVYRTNEHGLNQIFAFFGITGLMVLGLVAGTTLGVVAVIPLLAFMILIGMLMNPCGLVVFGSFGIAALTNIEVWLVWALGLGGIAGGVVGCFTPVIARGSGILSGCLALFIALVVVCLFSYGLYLWAGMWPAIGFIFLIVTYAVLVCHISEQFDR